MKKLFKDIKELQTKCQKAYDNLTNKGTKAISPRYFRTSIGVSKHLLYIWSNKNQPYFHLIKRYEDKLLALLENLIIDKVKAKAKVNVTGLIFILKAYDRERYIPEMSMNEETTTRPIIMLKPKSEEIVLNDSPGRRTKDNRNK